MMHPVASLKAVLGATVAFALCTINVFAEEEMDSDGEQCVLFSISPVLNSQAMVSYASADSFNGFQFNINPGVQRQRMRDVVAQYV